MKRVAGAILLSLLTGCASIPCTIPRKNVARYVNSLEKPQGKNIGLAKALEEITANLVDGDEQQYRYNPQTEELYTLTEKSTFKSVSEDLKALIALDWQQATQYDIHTHPPLTDATTMQRIVHSNATDAADKELANNISSTILKKYFAPGKSKIIEYEHFKRFIPSKEDIAALVDGSVEFYKRQYEQDHNDAQIRFFVATRVDEKILFTQYALSSKTDRELKDFVRQSLYTHDKLTEIAKHFISSRIANEYDKRLDKYTRVVEKGNACHTFEGFQEMLRGSSVQLSMYEFDAEK